MHNKLYNMGLCGISEIHKPFINLVSDLKLWEVLIGIDAFIFLGWSIKIITESTASCSSIPCWNSVKNELLVKIFFLSFRLLKPSSAMSDDCPENLTLYCNIFLVLFLVTTLREIYCSTDQIYIGMTKSHY